MTTNTQIHEKAVYRVACNLIENDITTRSGPGKGIDLILDNGKTILVRGMSNEIPLALMHGQLNMLKSDYIVIITNLIYTYTYNIYMMTTEGAKRIARNMQNRSDGCDDWFIGASDYRYYTDNYNIFK